MLWPHIDAEYQQELQGIADGAAEGVNADVWDIVALNSMEEVPDITCHGWMRRKRRLAHRACV